MHLNDLFEGRALRDLDVDRVYDVFRQSYEQTTGKAWSREHFISRARNWTFYGDETGYVSVRAQRSGMKKLVGVAGDPRGINRGIMELQAEGGPIWGAVSEPLARMAKKRGMLVPNSYPGGSLIIRAQVGTIPPEVFGGSTPVVNRDGTVTMRDPEIGEVTKVLICNTAYLTAALKLDAVREALAKVPGARTILRLMGINQSPD